MRVSIAAVAVALGLAAVSAQGLRIVELTTYSGRLPCADCVGIQYVLSLRPDRLFYLQRTYLHSENSGETVLDFGSWTFSNGVLTVTSTTGEAEAFAVSSAHTLSWLDRDGRPAACPDGTEQSCALARESRAQVPSGSYRIRAVYNEAGGRRTLQPCGSVVQFQVETSGSSLPLQRLSQASAGGKSALVTVTGLFERPGNAKGAETVRIANVLTAQTGGACAAAVRVSAVPRGLAAQDAPLGNGGDPASVLIETSWVLTEINHALPPAGSGEGEASIRFLDSRRVSGFTGCNRFYGAYTLAGRSIRLDSVLATRRACPASANIEAVYMKVLADARQIDILGESLDLLNAAGQRIVRFRAVHHR